jgi:hypothetical protein
LGTIPQWGARRDRHYFIDTSGDGTPVIGNVILGIFLVPLIAWAAFYLIEKVE